MPRRGGSPGGTQTGDPTFPFWCLMFFTFVLFMTPQGQYPVLLPLRLAATSAGLGFGALVLWRLAHGKSPIVMVAETRLLLGLLFLALLSIPFSRWPGGSLDALLNQFAKSLVVFLLIAGTVLTTRRLRLLIGSMALWGALVALTAIQNYSAGEMGRRGLRISGYESPLAQNPNDLALTLNLVLALVIGLYWAATNLPQRLVLLALMGLLAGGVIATFSRGGFLGLAAILIFFAITRARDRGTVALVPLFVLIPLFLFLLPQGYAERLASIWTFQDETGSASARWAGMRAGLIVMLQNPLTGVGFDMNNLALREVLADPRSWNTVHNVYLQIGTDLGFPGLVVYMLLVTRLMKGLRLSLSELRGPVAFRKLYALGQGVQICLVGFLIQALFFPVAYHFYFYYVAGLAVAFRETTKRSRLEPSRERFATETAHA